MIPDGKGIPHSSVEVKIKGAGLSSVIINPQPCNDKFASQFWCLNTNPKEGAANCKFEEKVVRMKRPTLKGTNTDAFYRSDHSLCRQHKGDAEGHRTHRAKGCEGERRLKKKRQATKPLLENPKAAKIAKS